MGNLATCVSFGSGTRELLHFDAHDDQKIMSILIVAAEEGQDWDHSNQKGDIQLPTLGISVPLYPGDIVFFQSAILPHRVVPLDKEDRHKGNIATCFTCGRMSNYFNAKAIPKMEPLLLLTDDRDTMPEDRDTMPKWNDNSGTQISNIYTPTTNMT